MIISNKILQHVLKHSTTFFCRCPKLKILKAARLLISHRYVIGDTQPICHSSSAMLIKTVGFYSCYCCYMPGMHYEQKWFQKRQKLKNELFICFVLKIQRHILSTIEYVNKVGMPILQNFGKYFVYCELVKTST